MVTNVSFDKSKFNILLFVYKYVQLLVFIVVYFLFVTQLTFVAIILYMLYVYYVNYRKPYKYNYFIILQIKILDIVVYACNQLYINVLVL